MKKPNSQLVACALVFIFIGSACFALDLEGKTSCETTADCLNGLACVDNLCRSDAPSDRHDGGDGDGDGDSGGSGGLGGGGGGGMGGAGSGGAGSGGSGGSSGATGGSGENKPACEDGVQGGHEEGVDCGVACRRACFERIPCDSAACTTRQCFNDHCVHHINGSRTDFVLEANDLPYLLTDEGMQISGVFTIEPGVVLLSDGYAIRASSVVAVGTPEQRITLEGVVLDSGASGSEASGGEARYRYVDGYRTTILAAVGNPRSHSDVVVQASRFLESPPMYFSYPTGEVRFERNVFIDVPSLRFGLGVGARPRALIAHNYFEDAMYIEVFANYDPSSVVDITRNTFEGGIDQIQGGPNVTARENYWDTIHRNSIAGMIYDRNDSFDITTVIPFEPFLTEPDPVTPTRYTIPSYVDTEPDAGVEDGDAEVPDPDAGEGEYVKLGACMSSTGFFCETTFGPSAQASLFEDECWLVENTWQAACPESDVIATCEYLRIHVTGVDSLMRYYAGAPATEEQLRDGCEDGLAGTFTWY